MAGHVKKKKNKYIEAFTCVTCNKRVKKEPWHTIGWSFIRACSPECATAFGRKRIKEIMDE